MKQNRLYVIARTDLPCSLPAVQAGHVVAEFCLNYHQSFKWNNETLIYLGVDTLRKLKNVCKKLDKIGKKYTVFKEPDINNEVTAVAVWFKDETDIFDRYKLLT